MKFAKPMAIALAALLLLTSRSVTLIAEARVTEADKQKVEEQLSKNESKLQSLKNKIKQLKADAAAATEIKEQLDAEAAALQDNIDLTEGLIDTYQKSIKDTIIEISEKQRAVDLQYEQIKTQLRVTYENGNSNYLEIVFSSSSLTEMLTRTERLRSLTSYQKNQIRKLEEQKKNLASLRAQLEKDLAQTEILKASLEKDKAALKLSIAEAIDLIASIEKKQEEAQKQQDTYEKAEEELEKELQDIITDLKNQAAAGLAQGSYIWPVAKSFKYISSDFGWRKDPFTGERKHHNGIDIPCYEGQPVYASNHGVVVTADYNKSYGYYIMLSHGDGIVTLYAHNSKLCVSVGQVVQKGDVIAKAGSSGRSTGPHCHFEVRIDGVRVDPLDKTNRYNAYVVVPK